MKQQNYKNISLNLDISKDYNKLSRRKIWFIVFTALITLLMILINLSIGSSNHNIFELILGTLQNSDSEEAMILFNLRLPHVLSSLIAGATLAICGCILQSTLGNPLAAPSTIGVSQGAACGACIAIVSGASILSSSLIIVLAFVFSLIPTALIFAISKLKNFSATSIILAGIALSIFFGGIVALVEYFADSSKVAEVVFWTFGSVYNTNLVNIAVMAIMLTILCIYSAFNILNFNAIECGDITAHSIGIKVTNSRLTHLIFTALTAACVTAFCGTINFIGLIAPHIMRQFVGSNYKYLIPTSALCGATILSLSDICSSILLPGAILPIGAITSFIGAPIFIWILLQKRPS